MPTSIKIGGRHAFALDDGVFHTPDGYYSADGIAELTVAAHGTADYPIGAFLWPGERTVLVDAGLGPRDYHDLGMLIGGGLLDELRATGHDPADVDVVALSHLHPDHAGWIASDDGVPTFPNATVVLGEADWRHFVVDQAGPLEDHIAAGLATLDAQGRVELVSEEREVAPGVRLMPAPGHTPGHSVFVLHDEGERVLMLGDSLLCPLQMTEQDFSVLGEVDPAVARRTRESLARELEGPGTRGVGCHFPGLVAGRLLAGAWLPDAG